MAPQTPPQPPRASPRLRILAWISAVGVVPLILATTLGLFGGLGAFTFGYGKGFSYLRDDPASCANCHVMQDHYTAWQRSSHHGVATCNDCHLPHNFVGKWWVKSDNGFFHSLAFTTGQYHDPIQIKDRNRRVTQNACLHCHQTTVAEMYPAHASWTGGTGAAEQMLQCVQCHNDVGHAQRRRGTVGFGHREPATPDSSP